MITLFKLFKFVLNKVTVLMTLVNLLGFNYWACHLQYERCTKMLHLQDRTGKE